MNKIILSIILLFSLTVPSVVDASTTASTASAKPITLVSVGDNSQGNNLIKASITKVDFTNQTAEVTIDTSRYNNGENSISYPYEDEIYHGAKITIPLTRFGQYTFRVYKGLNNNCNGRDYIPVEVFYGYDTEAPNVKLDSKHVVQGILEVYLTFTDNVGIKRIKLPDGKYENLDGGSNVITVYSPVYDLTENGNQNFVVEDYAGNTKTFTINVNLKKIPLSVNKVKSTDLYITGKTVPYGYVYAHKTKGADFSGRNLKKGDFIYGGVYADRKGNFKIKLKNRFKTGSVFYIDAIDNMYLYTSKELAVKVVK